MRIWRWKIRTSVRQIERVEDERIHPPACHAWNTSKPGIHALLCHSHYHSMPFLQLASNHLAIGGEFAVDIMIAVSKNVRSTLKYSSTPVQNCGVTNYGSVPFRCNFLWNPVGASTKLYRHTLCAFNVLNESPIKTVQVGEEKLMSIVQYVLQNIRVAVRVASDTPSRPDI